MPQATGAFGATNVVALFQGFVGTAGANVNGLVTRAAQNCSVVRNSQGQYTLYLNNVVPDDCNFMAQTHQFIYQPGQTAYAVVVAFPPVGSESTGLSNVPPLNYINFGFYNSAGAAYDPNYYGLFNIAVFSCNDGLVGVIPPGGTTPLRTPGNP